MHQTHFMYKKRHYLILSFSGSSEFSRYVNPVIEEPDDSVVRQRGQPDSAAKREHGQHRISVRSSQPGHPKTPDRAVHRWRRRRRRNGTHNFTNDVRDGVLRWLRLRRICHESIANRSGSFARRLAGPKSGMIQRIGRRFDRRN